MEDDGLSPPPRVKPLQEMPLHRVPTVWQARDWSLPQHHSLTFCLSHTRYSTCMFYMGVGHGDSEVYLSGGVL